MACADFTCWLDTYLKKLNSETDPDLITYLIGLLEEEDLAENSEDLHETLTSILEQIIPSDLEKHCQVIISEYKAFSIEQLKVKTATDTSKTDNPTTGDDELKRIIAQDRTKVVTTKPKAAASKDCDGGEGSSDEEENIDEILEAEDERRTMRKTRGDYEEDVEDDGGSIEKALDCLTTNTNRAQVSQAAKESREKQKVDHARQREAEKEDRERQKDKQKARKESEKKRTQKQERRR